MQEAAEAQYVHPKWIIIRNKLISAASSYNIERSHIAPLVGKVALFHATQALLAQARAPQGGDQGFRSGDTRKMAETSRGATVRNVPGTRSEARRSERSVTLVNLAVGISLGISKEAGFRAGDGTRQGTVRR